MPDGTLGVKVLDEDGNFTGEFEDSSIPGASDEDEVVDTRYLRARCALGSYSRRGPGGIATYFEPDTDTATSTTEYGEPKVEVDGATTCVIIPRTKVVTVRGTKSYYNWFDVCCTLVFSDCVTELVWVKDEEEEETRKTPLAPLITCNTDLGKLLLDLLKKLVERGVSQIDLEKLLGRLVPLGLGEAVEEVQKSIDTRPSREEQRGDVAWVPVRRCDEGDPSGGR